MPDMLVIEDDDGFRTEWPWPEGKTILGNREFFAICEKEHDRQKSQQNPT